MATAPDLPDATWHALEALGLPARIRLSLGEAARRHHPPAEFLLDFCLAQAAADGAQEALAAFEARAFEGLQRYLERYARPDSSAEDLVQETRAHLLAGGAARLRGYVGRGPAKKWVRAVATRLALGRRARREVSASDSERGEPVTPGDLATALAQGEHRRAFQSAFRAALARLEPRPRNLLRLHHLQGVGLDALATMYKVHRATIARWLSAARTQVLLETRTQLASQLALSRRELDSLLRLGPEQLTVSLRNTLESEG